MEDRHTSFKRESESHWLMEHNWFVCLDSELRIVKGWLKKG